MEPPDPPQPDTQGEDKCREVLLPARKPADTAAIHPLLYSSSGCITISLGEEDTHEPAYASPSERGRHCFTTAVATCVTLLVFLVLVGAVVLSVLWGATAKDPVCSGLTCAECGRTSGCAWCPGPLPQHMPGYCEVEQQAAQTCLAQPSSDTCEADDSLEKTWTTCATLQTEPLCLSSPRCEFCNATTIDRWTANFTGVGSACVPRAAHNLGPSNGSASLSFCNASTLVLADRPGALSLESEACVALNQELRPQHIDRSDQLVRLPSLFATNLAMLVCVHLLVAIVLQCRIRLCYRLPRM